MSAETPELRADLAIIADWIRPYANVLDLGCGDGALLSYLSQVKHCHGYGVEIDDAEVLACARRGVDVIQRNIEDGLGMFRGGDKFDVVVLSMALHHRARASLLKGATMAAFGAWVLLTTLYQFWAGSLPNYHEMSIVGVLALLANVTAAALLYTFREGDSNMRGVWICSRNDAIGNLLVIAAAGGVYLTGSNLPDLLVALALSALALKGASTIIRQARQELRATAGASGR